MLSLPLTCDRDKQLNILCLGAHGDDIEIGCGGTVLRLLEERPDTNVNWVVFTDSGSKERNSEIGDSASAFLEKAKSSKIHIGDFKDGYFPFYGEKVKEYFEQLKKETAPDIILTHYRNDLHQDHRLVSNLTWNTWRDHLIFEYEIPKWDGDIGSPNLFVPLDEQHYEMKIEYLLRFFKSQQNRHWFDREIFLSMLRLRGLECNSSSRYAEAFYSYKLTI